MERKLLNALFFVVICLCTQCGEIFCDTEKEQTPRVCVIGAGVSGLASARYLKDEGISFTILEATQHIGGLWRYDPRVGHDANGFRITSVYKNLRANLPKRSMEFLGFPTPDDMPSFPSWEQFYGYVKSFAKHYDLVKHIQFLHKVISVRREKNHWKVKYTVVPTGEEFEKEYDFVFTCAGHNSKPNRPIIPHEETFRGSIIHSHDYRDPEPYRNRSVLVVGAGPSGMDISLEVAEVSRTLIHSQDFRVDFRTPFPAHYKKKPLVKEFNETGVLFADGFFEEIDDVIYCTGYEVDYPFLDATSGLTLAPRYVGPLYQYMVNVHQPTMLLLGLVVRCNIVAAIDAQARYAIALVKGNFTLPSEEHMLREWQRRVDAVRARERPLSDLHVLSFNEDKFFASIAKESGTVRAPAFLFRIRILDMQAKLKNLYTYRNYEYDVVDEKPRQRYVEPETRLSTKNAFVGSYEAQLVSGQR